MNQPYVTRTGTRDDAVQKYRIYKNNGDALPSKSGSKFVDDWTVSNTLHLDLVIQILNQRNLITLH